MRTIICRCEDLTEEEILEVIKEGYTTLEDLKRKLRLGMGPCQGRTCIPLAMRLLAKNTGVPLARIEIPANRPPIVPVPLGTLASEENEK
jgi:NAD(P)H-nitrite reductase large subunit